MAYLAPDFEAITNEIYCMLVQLQHCGLACEVLDYPPLALSAHTPIVTLHNDGATKNDYRNSWIITYRITIFINRAVEGSQGAERALERLKNSLHRLLAANKRGTYYSALTETIGAQSVPAFQVIDGQPYRQEEIAIEAHVEFCDIARPFVAIGGGHWLLSSDCTLVRYADRFSSCEPCTEPEPPLLASLIANGNGKRIAFSRCKVATYRGLNWLAANESKAISFAGTGQIIKYKG